MSRFDTCRVALVLLGAQGLAGQAPAVPRNAVLMQHTLSARAAEIVEHAALEACTNQGFQVAVAITDADGELMVMLRGDGAGVHLLDAARRKAFTAASSGARTSAWEKAIDERSGVPDPHIVELQNVLRQEGPGADLRDTWEVWAQTPGGLVYSLNPVDQARILAVGFHHLVEILVRADIPTVLLDFPRLAEDWDYLHRKLAPVLPHPVDAERARAAHARLADLSKVRVGPELAAMPSAGRPVMVFT